MNFIISILGWFLWNWVELVLRQKELEEDGDPNTNFHLKEFAKKKVYYWVGSFVCCFVLLWLGTKELALTPLAPLVGHDLGWSDLYYLGAGAAFEVIIFVSGKIKNALK